MGIVRFVHYDFCDLLLASETSEEFLNDNLAMALCLLVPAMSPLVAADLADKKFRKLLRIYAEAVLRRRLIYINHIAIARIKLHPMWSVI